MAGDHASSGFSLGARNPAGLLENDKILRVIPTDSSTALAELLDLLPVGAPVGLADPGRPAAPGEIVLGIGLEAAAATRLRVALPDDAILILDPATAEGIAAGATAEAKTGRPAVVVKPAAVSWRDLHAALVQPRLRVDDALSDLAQTIATLTGGLVTIEDTAARVLAYSRSSDEVDELRRLSILGRSGPPDYLALLREWGVYDRLARPDDVVEIAEHPASGVRRRLAVGVFAGRRPLGTIWVQQGSVEFGPQARQALLGAARLTADQLVSTATSSDRPRLADVLAGRGGFEHFGSDLAKPAVVAVLQLAPGPDETEDPAARQQVLEQLRAVCELPAVAARRRAMIGRTGERIVILLPAMDETPTALTVVGRIVSTAERVLRRPIRAGVGGIAGTVRAAGESLRQAEAALTLATTARPVAAFEHGRNRLLIQAIQNVLGQQTELLDPGLERLIEDDPASAGTLLRYLDTGSDVSRVATELGVHATTVRYRIRRTGERIGLDLSDPDDRLAAQLQLRHGLAGVPPTDPPPPTGRRD